LVIKTQTSLRFTLADARAKAAAVAKEQRASAMLGYYQSELEAYGRYIAQLEDQGIDGVPAPGKELKKHGDLGTVMGVNVHEAAAFLANIRIAVDGTVGKEATLPLVPDDG
jgi:hypothetical protein